MYAKLVVVAFLWGGTFVGGRVLAQAMPPLSAAVGRFAVAAVLLLVLAYRVEGGLPRLDRRQALSTAALGLTGIFLYNLCFFSALARMPAGRTALFVALNPTMTAVAASFIFRERLGRVRWLGIAVALLGAVVVITRGEVLSVFGDLGRSFGLGELMMCSAVMSWVAYTLVGRSTLRGLSPIAATTYATLWGFAFLVLAAGRELLTLPWASYGWQVWVSMLYMGALGTVLAFVWFSEGVKGLGPSRAAVFTNLVPAFGVLLGALMLREPVLVSMLVGGAVSAAGVALTNRSTRRPAPVGR